MECTLNAFALKQLEPINLLRRFECEFQLQGLFLEINSGGQIESFKNRGGQNLNQVEFSIL